MIPTITGVRNWTPAVLHDRAKAVDTVAAHLDNERGALTDTAGTLWQSWQGRAADAAEKHLHRERRSVVAVVEHLRHVADQLRRADTALASFVPANFTVGMTMDMLNPDIRDTFTIPETPTENFTFTMNESLVTAENDVRLARLLVGTDWERQSPSAIDGLSKAGILAEDGALSPDPNPLAHRSSQRVHTFIANAIDTEFGVHHFDRYSNEYRRSYLDVAPTVHFTSTN